MKTISIIDYEMSNLNSIKNAMDYLGYNVIITSDQVKILKSYAVILPGVGSFPAAMKNLNKLNLIETILKCELQEKPLLGICLGMQLLFKTSEEFSIVNGLELIPGHVKSFKHFIPKARIPHVGWNKVSPNNNNLIKNNEIFFYFVHSFFSVPTYKSHIYATSNYDGFNFLFNCEK